MIFVSILTNYSHKLLLLLVFYVSTVFFFIHKSTSTTCSVANKFSDPFTPLNNSSKNTLTNLNIFYLQCLKIENKAVKKEGVICKFRIAKLVMST